MNSITWVGRFDTTSAWGIVNTNLTAALEKRGFHILRNVHNIGTEITPIAVYADYPPRPLNVRHAVNIAYTSWEFEAIPASTVKALNTYDYNVAACQWTADAYRKMLKTPVTHVWHGYDPDTYYPAGQHEPKRLLWVGGTDPRHGLDTALKVIDLLPTDWSLTVKLSTHYPDAEINHSQVNVIRQDLSSLAPLYWSHDILLHTAKAVGFSLPVLEAIACGRNVVSTDLPAIREFAHVNTVVGETRPFKHHLHPELSTVWRDATPEDYATAILNAKPSRITRPMTWDDAAERFGAILEKLAIPHL